MSSLKIKQLLKRASAHMRKGSTDEAVAVYNSILAIDPDNYLANSALKAKGITPTVVVDPSDTEKRSVIANFNQGNFAQAAALAKKLVGLYPKSAQIWKILASAHASLKNFDEAIPAFQTVVALNPEEADGYVNLGAALQEKSQFAAAVENYNRAIELNPMYAIAHFNLGNSLKQMGNFDGAIDNYRRTIQLSPSFANAHGELANILNRQSQFDAAMTHYKATLKLSPEASQFEVKLRHMQQHMCDFSAYDDIPNLLSRIDLDRNAAFSPFSLLSWEDNPHKQLARARKFIQNTIDVTPLPRPTAEEQHAGRVRVGYFSADFHDHPTLFLLAGLMREHDNEKFEIIAYSYGHYTTGKMREQVMRDVDAFHDVSALSDAEIVALAHSHDLDIAIDLKGFTSNSRFNIFSHRLAPIQINFLGFPGTMGADFIDYIVGDPVLIPQEHREAYSESVLYMPQTYFPTDNANLISESTLSRADAGLPEDALVFCCFNNSYKIGREEFWIWMNILNEVENSVLWLLDKNHWVADNLRREARSRGVDPSRLVFAKKVPQADHLARHRLADLFVDCFNYNAHTTASDALWSGLPLVTKSGKQFSARVATSILTALGMEELITASNEEYQSTIINLARDSEKRQIIREKLARNINTMPLFDTVRYTRNFEQALLQAHNIYREGGQPRDLFIQDDG